MDELIPYQEPLQPLVRHVPVTNIVEVIENSKSIKLTPARYFRTVPVKVAEPPTVTPVPVRVVVTPTPQKVEVTPVSAELDEAAQRLKTQKMMVAMTEIIAQSGGAQMHQINAALLNVFDDMPKPLLHYLAGSFHMGGNPAMDGKPPDWMLAAVSVERTKQVFEEYNNGTIGTLATPADVLTALYPPHYLMRCKPVMTRVMEWCMFQVMPKHAPDKMGGLLLMSNPPSYDSIRYEYEELAALVRRKIVESSKLSDKSSRKRKKGKKS